MGDKQIKLFIIHKNSANNLKWQPNQLNSSLGQTRSKTFALPIMNDYLNKGMSSIHQIQLTFYKVFK